MSSVGFLSLSSLEDARQFVSARALEKENILARVASKAQEISVPMQQFAVAEMKKHLLRFAPGWLEEMENMDAALELPENTVLKLQSYAHLVQKETLDCTSWIVAPERTSAGKMLLHKNRDSQFSLHAPLFFRTPGKFSWFGSCSQLSPAPLMGINEKGLAVAMNSGEACEKWNPSGLGTPMMARLVLENCSTPDEGAKLIEELRKEKAYSHNKHGSIFFYANAEYAGITEFCAGRSQYISFDYGYMIRANAWHLPGMTAMSTQSSKFNLEKNTIREFMVREDLNERIAAGGVTLADCITITRNRGRLLPENHTPVCRPTTIASGVFEIDGTFPELSTFCHLSGPARNTIALPLFAGGSALPPELVSCRWTARAAAFKERRGMDHVLLGAMEEVEKELFKRHNSTESKAKELLKAGKRQEALEVMQKHNQTQFEFAEKQFAEITGC